MTTVESKKNSKGLHISLWIVQGLLAVVYLMAGAMKAFQPIEELAKMLPWVAESSAFLVRFIGWSEIAGALGLLLPSLLRIQPRLTVYAAIGLTVVQVLAVGFHVMQGEANRIAANFLFIALSAFVAWGRGKKAVIASK